MLEHQVLISATHRKENKSGGKVLLMERRVPGDRGGAKHAGYDNTETGCVMCGFPYSSRRKESKSHIYQTFNQENTQKNQSSNLKTCIFLHSPEVKTQSWKLINVTKQKIYVKHPEPRLLTGPLSC